MVETRKFDMSEKVSKIRVFFKKVFIVVSLMCILFTVGSIYGLANKNKRPARTNLTFTQKWNKIKIQSCARKYAQMYAVPQEIVLAVIQAESGYRLDAVSSAGAQGLCQVMPQTFKTLMGAEIKKRGANPFNPDDNINAGVRYLAQLKKKYGTWTATLSHYNSGRPNARYPETVAYVRKVLKLADYI